jgi:hypothetical protein
MRLHRWPTPAQYALASGKTPFEVRSLIGLGRLALVWRDGGPRIILGEPISTQAGARARVRGPGELPLDASSASLSPAQARAPDGWYPIEGSLCTEYVDLPEVPAPAGLGRHPSVKALELTAAR